MARRKRQQAEIEKTRVLILKSAARVFAQKGYPASTMAAIAEEAGYTTPTLYSYFKGKPAIFHQLVDVVLTAVAATYDEHEPAGLTFEQRFELLLVRQLKVIDQHSDAFTFLLALEASGDGPKVKTEIRHHMQESSLQKLMNDWLGRNLQDSEYQDLDPEVCQTFFHGVLHSFATRWAAHDQCNPFADQVSILVPLVLGGFAGLAKRQAL